MKVADAVRASAACPRPRCRAAIGEHCLTRTGRNHPERVRDAIEAALRDLAEAKGMAWPPRAPGLTVE